MRALEAEAHYRVPLEEWQDMGEEERENYVKHVRRQLIIGVARDLQDKGAIEFSDSKIIRGAERPFVELSAYAIVGGTKFIRLEAPLSWGLRSAIRQWWLRLWRA